MFNILQNGLLRVVARFITGAFVFMLVGQIGSRMQQEFGFNPLSFSGAAENPVYKLVLLVTLILAWLVMRYIGYAFAILIGRALMLTRDEISVALFDDPNPSGRGTHLERSLEWILPDPRL